MLTWRNIVAKFVDTSLTKRWKEIPSIPCRKRGFVLNASLKRPNLLKLIKEAFNEKIGSEVIGYYAIDKASRDAVNKLFDGRVVPIILEVEDDIDYTTADH